MRLEMSFEVPLCRLADLVDGDARGFDPLREGRDTLFFVPPRGSTVRMAGRLPA